MAHIVNKQHDFIDMLLIYVDIQQSYVGIHHNLKGLLL